MFDVAHQQSSPQVDDGARTNIETVAIGPGTMTIAVIGPLDDRGVEEIGERLSELAGSARVHLALDMSEVTIIGARGLQALMSAAGLLSARKLRLALFGCLSDVADLIDMIIPDQSIPVFESEPLALRTLSEVRRETAIAEPCGTVISLQPNTCAMSPRSSSTGVRIAL